MSRAAGAFCRRGSTTLLLTTLLCVVLFCTARAATPKDLLASGQVDEALQTLQQEIDRSPEDAQAYNLLCRAYFMVDQWDRGIPACERARNLNPDNSLYELWLGRIYGEKADRAGFLSAAGLAKKVRVAFERAVELDPKSWEARTDLAEFYLEAPGIVGGGKDRAQREADALMLLNPARSHWVAARIEEKDKDAAAAELEYRAAIAVSHSAAREWVDLAIFLRHTNRLDEMDQALAHLDSAPLDHPESLMDGASLLLRTGRDYSLGVRLLHRYLSAPVEEGPAFKAHDMLGQLLERQGDRKAAAEEYRAALALWHGYARAQEDLKRVTR
ncbi:MAG TPA: tetratricopeptide repeat protein [Terriglobales bacterium]|nr:tetratricopeptide repeat protein [Terriglobales bacterium]